MKDLTKKVLGLDFTIHAVPETTQEFNSLAQRTDGIDACLLEATNNVLYRGIFPDIRAEFLDRLENVTGIKRKTKRGPQKKDGTEGAEVYDETESKYFARVCATYKPEGKDEAGVEASFFQDLADEVSAAKKTQKEGETIITLDEYLITFDPRASARGTGETKIAKVYLDAADDFLKRDGAWQVRAVSKLQSLNSGLIVDMNEPGEDGTTPATYKRESVALAIKQNEDRKRKAAVDELGAE